MRINAKTAKKLRALAKTIFNEQLQKNPNLNPSTSYVEDTTKSRTTMYMDFAGKPQMFKNHGPSRVNNLSLRGIYRNLKKQVKASDGIRFE